MVMSKGASKERLAQQALSVAGGYGAFLLGTLVFRQQTMLFAFLHGALSMWFFYLFYARQALGFVMYGLASVLIVLGFLFGGTYFGTLWFGAALFTMFGALNTVNTTQHRRGRG